LPATSVRKVTKQLKLQLYQFQAVHLLQEQDIDAKFSIAIGFVIFVCEGVHVYNLELYFKWNTLYLQYLLLAVCVVCSLFNDFFSNINYVASNERVMNDKMEAVVT
jgi:hypothetical protein